MLTVTSSLVSVTRRVTLHGVDLDHADSGLSECTSIRFTGYLDTGGDHDHHDHPRPHRRGHEPRLHAYVDEDSSNPTCVIESRTRETVITLEDGDQIENEEYESLNIRVTYLGLGLTGKLDIRWLSDDGERKYEPAPGQENAAELADLVLGNST